MNVVDSSGWLEYFADGPNAEFFSDALTNTEDLIVPTICLYEVYKRLAAQRGHGPALRALAVMRESAVADVTASVAVDAARVSLELGLAMADSLILAIARAHDAVLWTQDADFSSIVEVRYVPRPAPKG